MPRGFYPDVNRISAGVCRLYKVNRRDLYVARRGYFNKPRDVAIYLVRYLRRDSLKGVGKAFKIKEEIRRDHIFKKRVVQLIAKEGKSQRQT